MGKVANSCASAIATEKNNKRDVMWNCQYTILIDIAFLKQYDESMLKLRKKAVCIEG